MKRKAVAGLALLAICCGGAFAQSNVTLYGIVDLGAQWNKQYSSTSNKQESVFSVDSGYQSGSRFGLRGAEPLGGGLSAIFTLEGGFDGSTGESTQGGLLFGRQAWGGLEGVWGTLVAGRIPTPSSGTGAFDMWAAVDPFAAGFGINQTGSTFIAANALREDNMVLYVTPALGGFKGAVGYSFNRGGSETAPQGANSNAVNLAASFTSGALYAVVTYDVLGYADASSVNGNAGNPDQKLLQVGGTFDLKIVKLHAAWADQNKVSAVRAGVSIAPPTAVTSYDNKAWMAGISVPLGSGSLLASYQSADGNSLSYATTTGTAIFDPDYAVWGLGFTYPFSKRTNVYLGYGQVQAKGSLSSTQVDRQQSALGLRHRF